MKIKYFDRAIEVLFLALVFILPLIFDRRIGIVFSGTKSAFLRTAIIILLMIWAIKLLLGGKHSFRRTPADWPILAYILAIFAATITSVHFLISFWGFYGRYEGLTTWFCFGFLFFIAINFFRGMENLKRLIAVLIPASATMAVYGIMQRHEIDPYSWGGVNTNDRVIATIGQPNFLAAYLIMAFFAILFFLVEQKKVNVVETVVSDLKDLPKKISGKKNQILNEKLTAKPFRPIDYLPILYFMLTPLIFIYTIYSQNGLNVLVWYLNFVVMTAMAVLFALNYEKLPKIIFDALVIITLGINYLCLFYTQSRGGFLGLIVAAMAFVILTPKESIVKNWKKLLVVILLILIGTLGTVFQGHSIFARFTNEIKVEGNSSPVQKSAEQTTIEQPKKKANVELSGAAGSRGETWKSAAGIISDNPVFGVGPEVLKMIFPRYETNLFRFREAFHVKQDRCHNETFDVPVTKGLIGFFLYLFVLSAIFGYGLKKRETSSDPNKKIMIAALIAAMAAYLIQNQFSFGVIAITSLFWILWAMVMNIDSESSAEDNKGISNADIPWIPVALVVAASIFLIYFSFQQFAADLHFKTAQSLAGTGNLPHAVPEFEKSLKIFPYEGGTITNYGIVLLNYSQRLPGPERMEIEKKAIDTLDYGMKVDPYNADNFYIASRIYFAKGDLPKAIDYAEKTLKIDPYYAEAHLTLANVYERMGNAAETNAHYDRAFEINPGLAEPKIKIGQKMIDENRLDEAFKLFQDMMASDPKNVDVHNALGTIYFKRGDKSRAKEEFQQVIAFDPNNAFAQKMIKWLK